MTMRTILLILLTTPLLSLTEPICSNPPPIPYYMPNLDDCLSLVAHIFYISKLQDDEPILWSGNPSALVRNRKLPYVFKDSLASTDCAFFVDALHPGDEDTFPTELIGETALEIVRKCMEEGIDGAATVGAGSVGPKRTIAVILIRPGVERGSQSGGTFDLNMTNVTLLGTGNSSGLAPSSTEDK
ncbi:hypothetical protein IMSHALPRED_002852 [Imshaugia aleurites]|uniref:Uncharacterized protein n=1 Tax=Imshaugia aleurites TaxID=172621 RepID=A0A8H3J6G3_9LECA|nr:hypothetical protein IMSHALPRED_002852 [Imshaugia aleurites]